MFPSVPVATGILETTIPILQALVSELGPVLPCLWLPVFGSSALPKLSPNLLWGWEIQ